MKSCKDACQKSCSVYPAIILSLFFLTIPLQAETEVQPGTIHFDKEWTPEGSPYLIMGEVIFSEDCHLTLQPGTVIMPYNSPGMKFLRVRGQFTAIGTPEKLITFTSSREGVPLHGLIFEEYDKEEVTTLRYCNLYGMGVFGVRAENRYVSLEFCKIDSSRTLNFVIIGQDASIRVSNCLFLDGNVHCKEGSELIFEDNLAIGKFRGIELEGNTKATIRKNTILITDPIYAAVKATGTADVVIENNNIICENVAIISEAPLKVGNNWWGADPPDPKLFRGKVVLRTFGSRAHNYDFAWMYMDGTPATKDIRRTGTFIIDPVKVLGRVSDEKPEEVKKPVEKPKDKKKKKIKSKKKKS